MSAVFAPSGSEVIPWLDGIAWLWRLGARSERPSPGGVGFGLTGDAGRLEALVRDGDLGAAVIMAGDPGDAARWIPARERLSGPARFEPSTRVYGDFTVFDEAAVPEGAEVAVRSNVGVHALRRDRVLVLAADPDGGWGRLDSFWVYEALAAFLTDVAGASPRKLPPIGCVRLDDYPGTAQHQLDGRARGDARQRRRIERMARSFGDAGEVLNLAVTSEALEDGERVPLDRVWPRSVAAMRDGVERGAFEVVCHGALLLATDALEEGRIDFREFERLDGEEAGARIDSAVAWLVEHLEAPETFVAPAWAYGPAAAAEASRRSLPSWHWPRPGPLVEDGAVHETLIDGLPGLAGLDYSPLERLAAAGIPPTVVMHGALFDARLTNLSPLRNPLTLARLALRRDIFRLPALAGVRWVGAGDFVRSLRDHSEAPAVAS